jgi:hypothetical protein
VWAEVYWKDRQTWLAVVVPFFVGALIVLLLALVAVLT